MTTKRECNFETSSPAGMGFDRGLRARYKVLRHQNRSVSKILDSQFLLREAEGTAENREGFAVALFQIHCSRTAFYR
jgi:hypothetical protein